MTRSRPFAQVDVFASSPLSGNPLAVVVEADGLSDDEMAAFARWTNLSETTFLLAPTTAAADYRVRIFTGSGELPFAGHPTLGSAHVWRRHTGSTAPEVVQECDAGLVTVRAGEDGALAFAAPPRTRTGPLDDETLGAAVRALGIDPSAVVDHEWGVNGPDWAMLQLTSASAVLDVRPDHAAFGDRMVGLVGFHEDASGPLYEVRAFCPGENVTEDPVTGSLNAALAQWLHGRGVVPQRYSAQQGTNVGSRGEIRVQIDGDTVWVGGRAHDRVEGTVTL